MEEIKQKLGVFIEEVISVIHGDEDIMVELIGRRKEDEEQQMEGKDEQSGVFLEEELILLMMHKDQGTSGSLIGAFESSLMLEGSGQCCPKVGLFGKCVEEANHLLRSGMQVHSPLAFYTSTNELGFEEPGCSGPEYPPGFDDFIGVVGFFDWAKMQCVSKENFECENSLEEGNEADQSFRESHGSFSNLVEKVPETPMLESISILKRDDNEVVEPIKEDLVEVSWDVGKILWLKVSNEKAMIAALAKVQECQDFVLLRRRGCPNKNKGRT